MAETRSMDFASPVSFRTSPSSLKALPLGAAVKGRNSMFGGGFAEVRGFICDRLHRFEGGDLPSPIQVLTGEDVPRIAARAATFLSSTRDTAVRFSALLINR